MPLEIGLNFYANKLQIFFDNGRKLLLFLKRLLNLLKIFLSHLPEDIIKLAGTITLIRDITLDYYKFSDYYTCGSNRVAVYPHIILGANIRVSFNFYN